ncbi:MAG: site-2 protease family protein [Candidatus Bathyarchaeota archaeon]|nr:site-2 protease family protein [Candidatus Bathyarchaeota archaeon]
MASEQTITLAFILVGWISFYFLAKRLKLEEKGWEITPYYALYKSTKLNDLIKRIANISPRFWKVFGNIGIAASVGQVSFITYVLVRNIWNFIFVPEQASPVQPLIPGVTISFNSLPWFLLGAGIIIFTHELGHGLMCVIEDVPVKSSAVMFAVITFGGAVEPDEEAMQQASIWSKMRIYAIGSIINLATGLLMIPIFIMFGRILPVPLMVFFNWIYFVAINLAMMNMLPIGPLDGGQMWREFTARFDGGQLLQKTATYGFIAIILCNIGLSLAKFGLVPI